MVSTLQLYIWFAFFVSLYIIVFFLLTFMDTYKVKTKNKNYSKNVSICIPAYNEEKGILNTLDSLTKLDYLKENLQIIVVDDGSKDKTSEIVEDFIKNHKDFDIELITQKNSGKGAAINNGLKVAKYDFFVVLDADSVVANDALKKMMSYFSDPDVAVVLPLMKIQRPKSLIEKIQWVEYLINFFYKFLLSILNAVHVSPGPFSIYRKNVLISVGGFSENNLTEDYEITLRIQKNHYKIIQRLDAEVYTKAPDNLYKFYKQRNRWYKGTMINTVNYRKLIFNRKYGDFGLLQMPQILLSGIFSVSLLLLTLYNYVFKPARDYLYKFSKIDFDFITLIKTIQFNFDWIKINFTNLFFLFVTLALTIIVIIIAHKYTKEKLFRYGIISIPAYLLIYSIIISGVWLGVFIDMLFNRKQKW